MAKSVTSLKEVEKSYKSLSDEHNTTIQDMTILMEKYNELLKKMNYESETTMKALEKAISSSVRLCVVAPTVNAHIADKKLKMQSK